MCCFSHSGKMATLLNLRFWALLIAGGPSNPSNGGAFEGEQVRGRVTWAWLKTVPTVLRVRSAAAWAVRSAIPRVTDALLCGQRAVEDRAEAGGVGAELLAGQCSAGESLPDRLSSDPRTVRQCVRPIAGSSRPRPPSRPRARRVLVSAHAGVQPDLASNHCRRAGLAKRLDQPGHPGVAGNQSPIQFDIDLKNQPIRHFSPRDSLREVDVTDEAPI